MGVLVAVDGGRAAELAAELAVAGVPVAGVAEPAALPPSTRLPADVDTLVLQVTRRRLTAGLVSACDGAGVRILPLCATEADRRAAASFGIGPVLPTDADGWMIADTLADGTRPHPAECPVPTGPRMIAVWGPAGSPGRSTVAVELAVGLAGDQRTCLVDADTHASSLALLLGLADEGPGFATVCRQAARGGIDDAELDRVSVPLPVAGTVVDVLPGINRPSRWPELSAPRVTAALRACAAWADRTVVDVAASLEHDEEVVSDLGDGPRRNAATIAALQAADHVVAVLSADPLGVARFLRAHAELRATVGTVPVTVVANRLRPGTLGVDARGQVRRTLERFAGIREVVFVPHDARAVDAAVLAARPAADVAGRSPLSQAMRRVASAVAPPAAVPGHARRRRRVRAA